jgi:two-component system, OmpR family, sensor kinase
VDDSEALAERVAGRPRVDVAALPRVRARGYAAELVTPGTPSAATPGRPFTAADVAGASPAPAPVERDGAGRDWLVIARTVPDGRVLLLARHSPGRLTAAQRRRALLGGALGLAGGGLAGLAFALSIARPLRRVASVARRMSSGDRTARVIPSGPAEVADVAEALGSLSTALAASEERQRRFLLAVSHELRTPLTAVAGYAEALQDGSLPPDEVPHAVSVIVEESARLQRRVEDLLALARLEADDFRLHPAPTDAGAVLRAAHAAFTPRAAAAGVVLTVAAPPSGPIVVTDGERLRQMVDALADNALRVLPPGAPLILACGPTADGGARLEVRDGGPGLPPEDLAVAFERGRLTERYRGRRAVGSGVGLALVGELARRLGGRADALPAPEGGVTFAVTLPPSLPART